MSRTTILLSFAIGVVFVVIMCRSTMVAAGDMPLPPQRPGVFKTPHQLRTYLQKLNEYYAIVGRPRFGKRTFDDLREFVQRDSLEKPWGDRRHDY
ncbi:PREDICTED: pro-neuropeptide Y-like isoform X2 [Priapulus caudatus]|uniref:Pro-neuropeptide Y-like isoform X2 n=1 Tax=Priapulus caudatus TaxID=37621 RepID=A0ABM1FAI8_PRICU|nr:PREDICTED: pro-neuropeptide Y-like isoform X2 [Priapulus caudatus]